MLKLFLVSLFSFIPFLVVHGQNNKSVTSIEGEWLVHNEKSTVQVYQKEGKYFGKLAWVDPADNPNEEKRRAIMGTLILENLTPQGKALYKNGRVYNLPQDRHYDCDVKVKKDKMLITISIGWFSKTLVWTRVQNQYSQL